MSITPKTCVVDNYSIQQLIATHIFADLGEDAVERNHQDEANVDRVLELSKVMHRRRHSRGRMKSGKRN
jgi:hypothetical protein